MFGIGKAAKKKQKKNIYKIPIENLNKMALKFEKRLRRPNFVVISISVLLCVKCDFSVLNQRQNVCYGNKLAKPSQTTGYRLIYLSV